MAQAPTLPAAAQVRPRPGRRPTPLPPANYSLPYAARITPAGLRQDLSVLALDEYAGRETGQPGQRIAADYLARAFAAAGLTGPVPGSDNPYFQPFTLRRLAPAAAITIGSRTFVVNKDYYVLLRDPGALATPVRPAFVGYGINTKGYADFAAGAPDLRGKDLVLLLGEPQTPAGQPLLGQAGRASAYGSPGFPEMMARSPALFSVKPHATFRSAASAAAFARVPQDYEHLFDHPNQVAFPEEPAPAATGLNVFIVSPEMGAALLGTTPASLAQYQQAVAATGQPVASPFTPATPQVTGSNELFATKNVLGYLAGTDKKAEVVVVSAHYDHLGTVGGQVYHGADGDGSGTVSVLALARAFAQAKKAGHGPRRSLLFLANVAEEIGRLGSQYYTEHPVVPLANTVADLHIDMLGRVDSVHQGKGDYVYAIGSDWISQELRALSEATNQRYQPLALDYIYTTIIDPTHLYRRSDHYSFANYRVPVIFYTSGLHSDYHQPTDDVARIDFPALARRSQLVFHTAWALANRPARPALDAPVAAAGPAPADLARRAGTYASAQTKLKITLAATGNTLQAQTSDWQTFPLKPARPGVFTSNQAGLRLEFAADKPAFTLRQGGSSYVFTKQVG